MSKPILGLVALLCFCKVVVSQEMFFNCPYEENDSIIISECPYFFDPISKKVDSIDQFFRDTIFGISTLSTIAKPIQIKYYKGENERIEYIEEGTVILKGSMQNGQLHGQLVSMVSGDTITCTFNEGILHGTLKISLEDSDLIKNYYQGKLDGAFYETDKNGNYKFFRMYKNGQKSGLEYALHDNGMLHYYIMNKRGHPQNGVYFIFDGNGNILYKEKYRGGKLVKSKKVFNQ